MMQTDLFGVPQLDRTSITFTLTGIQAPRSLSQNKDAERRQNFHIPSFKNSKRWITKLPNGRLLKKPFLITSPEFQEWMEKAVQSIESQLFSECQTGDVVTPEGRLKLFAMLSLLPEDDSVNDLRESIIRVERVAPGQEGAVITIEKLT